MPKMFAAPTFNVEIERGDARKRYDHILLLRDAADGGSLSLDAEATYANVPYPYIRRLLAIRDALKQNDFGVVRRFEWLLPVVPTLFKSMFHGELCGIAETVNRELAKFKHGGTEVSVVEMYLLQAAYEASALCTSIVVQPDSTDCPVHIRSMDWEMPFLASITMDINCQRNGVTVYSGTTWLGFVGLLTGMRPDAFSISLNYRPLAISTCGYFWKILNAKRTRLMANLIRETLETADTFDKAVGTLVSTASFSPCYLTVAGSRRGEGALITKGSIVDHHVHVQWLSEGTLVQTNIDAGNILPVRERPAGLPDQGDVFDSRARHRVAHRVLSKLTPSAATPVRSPMRMLRSSKRRRDVVVDDADDRERTLPTSHLYEQLWQLMQRRPIFDEIMIYSTLMCARASKYETRIPMH